MKTPGQIVYDAWRDSMGTFADPTYSKLNKHTKRRWEEVASVIHREVSVQTIDELISKFQDIKKDILDVQ